MVYDLCNNKLEKFKYHRKRTKFYMRSVYFGAFVYFNVISKSFVNNGDSCYHIVDSYVNNLFSFHYKRYLNYQCD